MNFNIHPDDESLKDFRASSPLSREPILVGDTPTDSGFHAYMMKNSAPKLSDKEVEGLAILSDNGDDAQPSFGIFGLHIPTFSREFEASRKGDDPKNRSKHRKSVDKRHNGRSQSSSESEGS
jgi:hypothetical protein